MESTTTKSCKRFKMKAKPFNYHHQTSVLLACILIINLYHTLEVQTQAQTGSSSSHVEHSGVVGSNQIEPKSVVKKSVTSDSIALLLDEISNLKIDLFPESAKQDLRRARHYAKPAVAPLESASLPQATVAGAVAAAAAAAAPAGDQTTNQMKTKRTIEQQVVTSDGMQLQSPIALANSFRPKTICDESLAIATLGYRMLCQKQIMPRLAALTTTTPPPPPTQTSTTTTTTNTMTTTISSNQNKVTVVPESLVSPAQQQVAETASLSESNELIRLKGLLDKLIRSGTFRSVALVTAQPERR